MHLSVEDVKKLRQFAKETSSAYPFRPLMLEMALAGLSRRSISNLNVDCFFENICDYNSIEKIRFEYAVVWVDRNDSRRVTRLSRHQWEIAKDYLNWRKGFEGKALFLVKNKKKELRRIMPSRVRAEIRKLGAKVRICDNLEIPDLHRCFIREMRLRGIDDFLIDSLYGKKKSHEKK